MGALGLPVVVYLPEYYSNALGLPLAAVGSAFMGVRLLGIMADPFIGNLMDHTRSRWGRFRPWLAASAPLLSLAAWMLFMPGAGVSVAWLWLWLIVLYAGVSICVLSHTAWAATLSSDYDQRSRIYAWWQAGNVVGLILVLMLPALMDAVSGGGGEARIRIMGWFIAVLVPMCIGIAILRTPEPVSTTEPHKNGLRDFAALFRRPTVRRIMMADLLLGLAPGITAALFFFYIERVKDFDKPQAAILLLAYLIAALACAPLWAMLARRIGKHRAVSTAGLFFVLGSIVTALVPAGHLWLAVPALVVVGIPYSAGPSLLRSMLADVADEERLANGADRKGLLYATLAATAKLGYALAVGITFIALDRLGFDAGGRGDPQTGLIGLQGLFLIAPALCGLLAAWACFGYPLDARRHAEIRAQLAFVDAASPDDGGQSRQRS